MGELPSFGQSKSIACFLRVESFLLGERYHNVAAAAFIIYKLLSTSQACSLGAFFKRRPLATPDACDIFPLVSSSSCALFSLFSRSFPSFFLPWHFSFCMLCHRIVFRTRWTRACDR